MRKGFKKLVAVALSAGMLMSSFASGVTAQEKTKETKEVKKGTVIYGFKEVTDVTKFVAGQQYFFSLTEYNEEGAVAALPEGSGFRSHPLSSPQLPKRTPIHTSCP